MTKPQTYAQASPTLQEGYEYERALLARATSGEDVRNELVLYLQRPVSRLASRIHQKFLHRTGHGTKVEVLDLVNSANVKMLDTYPLALTKRNAVSYLLRVAYSAMIDCVNGREHVIKVKCLAKHAPIPVLSLDRPLDEEGTSLADLLSDVADLPRLASTSTLSASVQQAIETLPEKQRSLVLRYFGFAGTPVSLNQISRDFAPTSRRPNCNYHYKRALEALRQQLSEAFPQYVTGGVQ